MTPERYQQVKSAFRHALDCSPSEREQYLNDLCAQDPALLEHVRELLTSDSIPHTPLDEPVVGTQFRLRAMSMSYTATRR